MNCPNCQHPYEPPATECSRCGVIFEKWKARQEMQQAGVPAPPSTPSDPAPSRFPPALAGILAVLLLGAGFRFMVRLAGSSSSGKSPKTPHEASREGNLKALGKLLKKVPGGANQPDEWGCGPLSYARTREAAELLVQNGADVHAKDRLGLTALHAVETAEVAEFLIAKGAEVNSGSPNKLTPLHTARNAEVARVLIAHGARVHMERDPRGEAGPKETPLYKAVGENKADVVRVLLENGADGKERLYNKMTLLHYAAQRGYREVVEALLDSGLWADEPDPYGATALHHAVINDRLGAAEALLQKGASANARLSKFAAVVEVPGPQRVGPYLPRESPAGEKTPLAVAKSEAMKELLRKHGGTQ